MATGLSNAANRKTNQTLTGTAFGANLLPGSAPATGAGVSWNGGTGTAIATAATDVVRWLSFLTIGKLYQVTVNYTMSAGSKLRVTNGATNGVSIVAVSAVLGASGSITFNFFATDVNMSIEADTAVFTGTVSAIVVKEALANVATSTAAGGAHADRAISGLTYFSAVITTLTGTPQIGICDVASAVGTALGSTLTSVGYLSTGAVQLNGVTIATIAAYVATNRIDCAVDWGARMIWFRVNNGNWNNNVANNPATGVGGIDISTAINLGTATPAIYASLSGTVWTMEFSTPFTNAAPASFVTVDTIQYTVANWTTDPRGYFVPTGTPPAAVLKAYQLPNDESTFGKHYNGSTITRVSGTIMEVSVTIGGKRVDVYDRVTGELLGTTYSAVDGTWSVACLGRPSVRVVADDPTTYNSLVYDNVLPV